MPHPGTIVRDLLSSRGVTPVPGCHDALGALLIEQAGYPAVYMSGFSVAASFGKPDVGLLTVSEMVARAAQIARATSLPVIADADTGYGGPANIADCVQAFERAGIAAIHLEDQVMPKRCGALPGKALVPVEEMALRLAAARKARTSADFLI
ncbi:MAG: isocitrate lyase/PEP mutase family protein, partial [Tistlia sp.]